MKKINIKGFTLIEVIVAITILSIIMISVFTIFMLSADINNRTDISRAMQENIKNVVEIIAEDVRKNGISGVNNDVVLGDCNLITTGNYKQGTKLCVGTNSYFLAKKVGTSWIRVSNEVDDCNFPNSCSIVRQNSTGIHPISNSWVDFRNLTFYVSVKNQPKVSINFTMQPSIKKGIKPNLIKENKIVFQTTISQRLYNDY